MIGFAHVKGHQALTLFFSLEAVLNHWCDGKAKSLAATTLIGTCQRHFHFPAAKIDISCKGTVGQSLSAWLCGTVARADLLHYLQDKYCWYNTTIELIDWSSYDSTHWRLPYCQKTTMVKF